MGAHQLTLVFTLPAFTQLLIGDYVSFKGETYTLNQLPTVKKHSSTLFEYNCIFQSSAHDLAKAAFMLNGVSDFSLTANAAEFLQLIVDNLNRVAALSPSPPGEGWGEVWFVGDVIESGYKTLSFSSESCADVLSRLADEFETEWSVSGYTVHLSKVTRQTELTLQYGSTLYDLERVSVDSANIVTRLYPFGSERNIPATYRDGAKRLMIPAAEINTYIEANTGVYGVIEGSKIFEDIYPRLGAGDAGTVTAVNTENRLQFSDANLDFDVNLYRYPNISPKIHFTSGLLSQASPDITNKSSRLYFYEVNNYDHQTRSFTLFLSTDLKGYSVPNDTFFPQPGDTYELFDVVFPDSYVTAAEAELLAAAQNYLRENSHPRVNYRCTFSQLWHRANNPDVRVGDVVLVADTQLGINEPIRVVKISRSVVNEYDISLELANSVNKTSLQRMSAKISKTETGIRAANDVMKQRFTNSYRIMSDLRAKIFDPDGYFDPVNIKPLSIESSMLSAGAKSQTFQTDITFYPNHLGDADNFAWSDGAMVHFTIDETPRTWNVPAGSLYGLNAEPYYIYLKCVRSTADAEVFLSVSPVMFDDLPDYYHFLVGLLHSPLSPPSGVGGSVRGISLTYGQTTINGQFIRTGVVSSIDGASYFNLNTGDIAAGLNRLNGDGSGSLADANILWDALGNTHIKGAIEALSGKIGGLSIISNSIVGAGICFSNNNVEELSDLLSPSVISIVRQSSWSDVTDDASDAVATTQDIEVPFNSMLKFKVTTSGTGINGLRYSVMVKDASGNSVFTQAATGALTNQAFSVKLSPGTYTIEARSSSYNDITTPPVFPDNAAVISGYATADEIVAEGYYAHTMIGANGIYSFWDSEAYLYLSSTYGFEVRFGDYGLRVTTTGAQKDVGSGWENV